HPVQLRPQLAYDPLGHHAVTSHSSGWRQSVDFVEEDDAGRRLPRASEDLPYSPLRLTDPLAQQFGTPDADEVGLALSRDGLREKGLPRSRRTVKEDSLRHVVADGLVELRVLQRP